MGGPDSVESIFCQEAYMTAEDQAKYVRTCTMCEFITNAASAMKFNGGLNQSLSDRMDEVIEPVREARDWIWHVGQLMILSRPLPNGLHETLESTENRALEALPKFKALMDEACDELVRAAQRSKAYRENTQRLKAVRLNGN